MRSSDTLVRRLTPAIAAVMLAALGQAAASAATSGVHSVHFHLVTTATHVKFLGERRIPGGDYTASWRVSGRIVRVAAPSGSTVIVGKQGKDQAIASVRLPSSLRHGSLAALAAAYAKAGKSVAQDARAVGYSATQARSLARQASRGEAHRPNGAGQNSPAYSKGQIIETPCASVSGDGGSAYGRACDVQKMVQDNGGGNWIIGDEVTGSGNDTGPFTWNTLENLTAYVNYGAHNTIVQWTPNSSVNKGSCSTVSLGLTYDSVSLSDTETICPDREDPYGTNTSNKFGSAWSGCDSENFVEGVNAVDVDNNPSNASDWPGLTVSITWGFCL